MSRPGFRRARISINHGAFRDKFGRTPAGHRTRRSFDTSHAWRTGKRPHECDSDQHRGPACRRRCRCADRAPVATTVHGRSGRRRDRADPEQGQYRHRPDPRSGVRPDPAAFAVRGGDQHPLESTAEGCRPGTDTGHCRHADFGRRGWGGDGAGHGLAAPLGRAVRGADRRDRPSGCHRDVQAKACSTTAWRRSCSPWR
jgi:hypothetical protein